ncbi:MAG: SDR family NAD(P)-dependent oxidoreductase, partial [Proteobacteria bacterium]|nr:SDR family NAD(P)-dependent oxidoreductase [Pseudomonadota bacterium]
MGRLDQKVTLITGGASGLGKGIAQRFTEEGAITYITDISDNGEAVAKELGAEFLLQDTRSEETWDSVIQQIVSRHQRLDVLVNNAGIFSSCPV